MSLGEILDVSGFSVMIGCGKTTTVTRLLIAIPLSNQLLINAASSTGGCNTIQCIDSTMLPRENDLFG
jgi:hypothetical protein